MRKLKLKKLAWRICCTAAILLTALAFTPLVIPAGRSTPMLAGIPFTLWSGILISIALVVITFLATRVHPGTWEDQNDT